MCTCAKLTDGPKYQIVAKKICGVSFFWKKDRNNHSTELGIWQIAHLLSFSLITKKEMGAAACRACVCVTCTDSELQGWMNKFLQPFLHLFPSVFMLSLFSASHQPSLYFPHWSHWCAAVTCCASISCCRLVIWYSYMGVASGIAPEL